MVNEVRVGDVGLAQANPKVAVTRPERSTAQAISDAGAITGEAVEGIQRRRAATASQEVGQALSAADALSQARMRASAEQRNVTPEEQFEIQRSLTTEKARKHFANIAAGLDQRGFGRGKAALRARTEAENEIRNIVGLTPGFSDSIRSTARDVLGFDPTGDTINSLFNSMKDPEIEEPVSEDKKLKDYLGSLYGTEVGRIAYAYRGQTGRTAEQTMAYLRNTGKLSFYNDLMLDDLITNRGEKTDRAVTDGFVSKIGSLINFNNFVGTMYEEGKLVGGMDTLDQQNALAGIAAEKARILRNFQESVQDPAQIKRVEEAIDREAAGIISLIENTNSFDLLKEHVDTFQQLAKIDLINRDPEFMTYALGLNPQLADKVLSIKQNAGSEEALGHILQNYPGIAGLFDKGRGNEATRYIQGQLDNVLTGRKNPFPAPNPQVEREARRAAVDTAISNGALADEGTSKNVQEADKKLTYVRVAEDPALALTIPDGEAWDTFRTNYVSDMELIAKQAAQDVLDAGLLKVEQGEFGGENQITFAVDEDTPWWQEFSIVPDSVDRFNETFLPIMSDPRVSQRLFNGKSVNPNKLWAAAINANIQQLEIQRVDKELNKMEKEAANYRAPITRSPNDPNRYSEPTQEEIDLANTRTERRVAEFEKRAEELRIVKQQLEDNLDMYMDQQRKWGIQTNG